MPRKPRAKRADQGDAALETRREQVLGFLARGFRERAIAEALDVTRDAVHRDIVAMRPLMREALTETAEDIYADATAELAEVRREFWLNYARVPANQVGLRVSILNSIAALPSRRVELGQRLGLVASAPERSELIVKVQRALADVLMEAEPEEADALVKKLLDVANTP